MLQATYRSLMEMNGSSATAVQFSSRASRRSLKRKFTRPTLRKQRSRSFTRYDSEVKQDQTWNKTKVAIQVSVAMPLNYVVMKSCHLSISL